MHWADAFDWYALGLVSVGFAVAGAAWMALEVLNAQRRDRALSCHHLDHLERELATLQAEIQVARDTVEQLEGRIRDLSARQERAAGSDSVYRLSLIHI